MTILTLSQFTDTLLFRSILMTVVILSFGIYWAMNKPSQKRDILMFKWDRKLPFLPAFSVPYLLFLPFLLFVTVYGIMATPFYPQIALSAISVQLVAAYIYYRQQTHVPRPHVPLTGLFNRLTAFIYRNDEPYCTFPSLHVAYSVICGYWSMTIFPTVLAPAFAVLSISIIASTLFLKQHVIADVLGGIAVAALSLTLSGGAHLV